MKKILLLLILILGISPLFAQNSDFEVNRTDEVTGAKILKTKLKDITDSFFANQNMLIGFSSVDSKASLIISMSTRAGRIPNLDMRAGSSLTLTLNNQHLLHLLTKKEFKTDKNQGRSITILSVTPSFEIDKKQLIDLQKIGIESIKIETNNATYSNKINAKQNKLIASMIQCLFDAM